MTRDFIEGKIRETHSLIMEGTRLGDEGKEESEELVSQESRKIISTTNRLILADFNFKDVDRLRTFLKWFDKWEIKVGKMTDLIVVLSNNSDKS